MPPWTTPHVPDRDTLLRRIFPGDSEMARRMRAKDWARTALGDPALWPPHLRLSVSLCLTSRFPILLWWGPELTVLYNDAYISFLGAGKHPETLGQPGQVCWAEIWTTIGPMLEGVMRTGEATWSEDVQYFFARHLPAEEVFVRFTYGPILSEDGRVDGVFTPCTETTAAVVSARRLRTLTRLAATELPAATLDAACRQAVQGLTASPEDTPFAALYLAQADEARAVVASQPLDGTSLPEVLSVAPAREATATDEPASLPAAIAGVLQQPDAGPRLVEAGGITVSGGPYPEQPRHFMVVPLPALWPERRAALLLGLSPRCPLDEAYREFIALAARHVNELLGGVLRYERERARVEALAELDRAKSLFFSNVSHELRTPLMLMLGPLDTALRSDHPHQDELAMVRRNAQRLQQLVDTLLDFSQLEAGRLSAQLEATDLAAATADVASLFRSTIEAGGLRLRVDTATPLRPYRVDRDMWEKVVGNLLSNAYKYTLAGEIRVRLRELPEGAELTVADTGVGIPAADQARLFQRFFRGNTRRGRTDEGTGIGLALTRELVALHGGDIRVSSEPEVGSTFTVRLPAALAGAPDTPVRPWNPELPSVYDGTRAALADRPAPDPAPEPAVPGGRSQVLVADDNEDMREYLRRVLAPHWDVRCVADGEAALGAMAERLPDLLLTDVMMPRLDGLALVQRVRANPRLRALPVILISARVGDEAKVAGLAAGADDYLTKPFSSKELVARIESQLMRARIDRVQRHFSSRLAEVLEQAPVGIAVTVGPDHVFEYANQHYRRFVPGRTLIGRSMRENFPDLQGQGVFELCDRVFRTGEAFAASPMKVMLCDADGQAPQERHFDLIYQPLVGPDGRVEGIATVASDVHEVVVARGRAEQANRVKDEFIAMLGHELRNPLSPIVTAVELVRRRTTGMTLPELDMIDRQVRHMVRLIDDLLDVSRITRGVVELRRVPVELQAVVAKAVETVAPLIDQRQHRLRLQVPERGLTVLADADRLAQVVANLLANAAKYTPAGGHIGLQAARQGDWVVLDVVDNGVGLTAAECERVFDLFVQGPQRRDRPVGGLGLGLTIARNLAQLHGGQLQARSEGPDQGCTFTLRLPLSQALPEGAEPTPAAAPRSAGAARPGLRVLVVDDNIDAGQAVALLLRELGSQVQVAHDGKSALQLAQTALPDLVLLDIGLPDIDGYALGRRLRELAGPRPPRLVALTGFGQQRDLQRSADSGFEAHLVKPASVGDLQRLLLQASPP